MQDFIVAMGASEGISHGISKVTGKKPVIFIGDSTFLHAGIPALLNLVYNKSDVLIIIMKNEVTAMCGGQPHPSTGYTAMSEQTKSVPLVNIAQACQADFVKISNVWNLSQLRKDIKEAYSKKGVSVVVAHGACRLHTVRNLARQGKDWPRFEIVKQKKELDKLVDFGCPAIMKKKGNWFIDEKLCWGCTVCKQLFPDCIKIKETKEKEIK
jgi:indolepyruvate ferredoxin oxidoreductase alpha subunit